MVIVRPGYRVRPWLGLCACGSCHRLYERATIENWPNWVPRSGKADLRTGGGARCDPNATSLGCARSTHIH
ncbi:MAG: hypothetical protein MZV64_23280 [Ignavibacteriales bacterium]|nr:hypothetical protein [Ignavibacteriales bacterium]